MLIGLSAAAPVSRADVSVDLFYNNLSGGSWVEVGDYGYCWQPDVAVSNTEWRPYSDGYWAYTDEGWTWVSYEDFGWATYHYGRWARLEDQGWVWVPGRNEDLEWGPAWVSWRTGDQYVGWAPLPPRDRRYEGRPIDGHVDVEFDIGPGSYNFVDVRYIGEPVLRERIISREQNITYVDQTVNVTNITYKNKTVYNYGPDINVINQRSGRPIQRLTIQRENNVDFAAMAKSGGLKTKVQGQSLLISAPTHITRSTQQIAPPNVKTKVAKANFDRGWSSVGDARAQEEFKQKLSKQDRRDLRQAAPARTNASEHSGSSTAMSPAASSAVEAKTGRGNGGKHNQNRPDRAAQEKTAPMAGSAPTAPVSSPSNGAGTSNDANSSMERGKGGKHKNRQGQGDQNGVGTSGAVSPAGTSHSDSGSNDASGSSSDLNRRGNERHQGRRPEQLQPAQAMTPAPGAQSATGGDPAQGGGGKHNGRNRERGPGETPSGANTSVPPEPNQGARKGHRPDQAGGDSPAGAVNPDAQGQGGGKHRGQRDVAQPEGAAGESPSRHEGARKNKADASPVPTP